MSLRNLRRWMWASACIVGALTAPAALATTPGANGKIAYTDAPPSKTSKEFAGDGVLVDSRADGGARGKVVAIAGGAIDAPEYSPDGKQLAYTVVGAKRSGLWVARADGSAPRRLVRSAWIVGISWTPDGKSIVYAEITAATIYRVAVDGSSKPAVVTTDPNGYGWTQFPTVSPDGTTVVFEASRVGDNGEYDRRDLWRVGLDGSAPARLFPASVQPKLAGEPDFAPDGKSIVFQGEAADQRPAAFTAPIDGSAVTSVFSVAPDRWVDGPSWSPDGKAVVLTTGGTPKQGSSLVVVDAATAQAKTVRRVSKGWLATPTWQPLPVG